MTKFIIKIIIFFLPISLLFVFPLFVYIESGEFTSLDTVLQTQNNDHSALFAKAYSYGDATYKLALIQKTQPDLVILGTSRVLELRNTFFINPDGVKNAGRFVEHIDDYKAFVEALPQTYIPKVIIVGLDPWLFSANQDQKPQPEKETLGLTIANFFTYGWRDAYKDYIAKKFTLNELIEKSELSNNIGLNALIHEDGYVYDGSLWYGKEIRDSNRVSLLQNNIEQYIQNFANTRERVEYSPEIPSKAISSLDLFLELCKKKHIYVVGYVIPFPHSVFKAFTNEHDIYAKAAYDFPIKMEKEFSAYDFPLFDYSDSGKGLITESEYIDAVHSTDKGALKILIDMTEHNSTLSQYISVSDGKKLLSKSTNDFILTEIPHTVSR